MKKLLHLFDRWPSYMLTILVAAVILFLMLDGNSVQVDMRRFIGLDKVVHAVMFGGFSLVFSLDIQRKNWMRHITVLESIMVFVVASLIGVAVEFMQLYMDNGRTFDVRDIVADIVGVSVFTLISLIVLRRYSGESSN